MNRSSFDATVNIPHTDSRDDCRLLGRNHHDFIRASDAPSQAGPAGKALDEHSLVKFN